MTTTFYFENSQGVILDEQGNKATGQEAVSANWTDTKPQIGAVLEVDSSWYSGKMCNGIMVTLYNYSLLHGRVMGNTE
jgi:hypothetical protein